MAKMIICVYCKNMTCTYAKGAKGCCRVKS
jgi:hypothetical protein